MSNSPVRENSLSAGSLDSGIKSIGLSEEGIRERPALFLSAKRWLSVISGIILLSLLIVLVCLTFGAQPIGMGVVMQTLIAGVRDGQAGIESAGVPGVIVWQVRLPRILLAFLVGGSLAGVGVALQALLRNPLAEPFVLGISSGAAFGATLAMLLGVGNTFLGVSTLPLWAFAGGLLAIMVVYRISVAYRMLSVHTLLLAGVILNALFSALIMFAISIADPTQAFKMMLWLMGTLTVPEFWTLVTLLVYLACGFLILFWLARPLNILTLGDESARSLGVEVDRIKKLVFVTSALVTGAVVSIAGLIGFVGMVVPHAVRMIIGADHRLLLPVAALAGGAFLTVADTVARTALAPTELPVGVVTALIGGPFFIYLLVQRRAGVPF
ncbi:MAG: iron ABC transporter permease [Nitrospirota bacterium]|nr:iron ABC transporter permease [Nitrospirota bacterium]